MLALRPLALTLALAIFFSSAHANTDSPITFMQEMKSAYVLFGIPRDLDLSKKITIVVYFHGLRGNEPFEDVIKRQGVAEQVAEAHVNAVLVVPSIDYSMKVTCVKTNKKKKHCKSVRRTHAFAEKGTFKKFLKDSVTQLARALNTTVENFDNARMIIIGYSAGHDPARMVFSHKDVTPFGVLLLDAHYGSQDIFANYAISIAKRHSGFFVTAYTDGTASRAAEFEKIVREAKMPILREFPARPERGMVVMIKVEGDHLHHDFVTSAWAPDPIMEILRRSAAH